MQDERRRYEVEGQHLAAQGRPSPHRPIAALAATIRGRAGWISLTAEVGPHGADPLPPSSMCSEDR
jgi:hypothetical protein